MTDLDPAETSSINKVFSFDTYHIKVCDYLVHAQRLIEAKLEMLESLG